MTATLISLLSILAGIVGANLTGFVSKKHSFDLVGNTIAGVFGSVLLIKSFGRLGFDPASVMLSGSTNWVLFFLNIIISFTGGVLSLFLMKTIQVEMSPNTKSKNPIVKLFRVVSVLEGVSYILLMFVGVPLKYLAGNAVLVKFLGMPHGILFMAYIVLVLLVRSKMNWGPKTTVLVLLASIIPFGTFYVDRKYF